MAGNRSGFSVTITAVDAATKQIDTINRSLEKIRAPAERLHSSFSKLAENTGITGLATGMRNVADASFRAFENIGRIVAPLGAITGAASLAGLSRLVTGFSDAGSQLQIASQRMRMGAGDLAAYEGAARLAGGSSEAMGAALKDLNDNIFKSVQGTAPDATIAFSKLGISVKNADGSLRSAKDVMPELVDKLSKIKDPTYRAQLATMALGGAADGLGPVLSLTGKQFLAYVKQAREFGTTTDEGAKKAWELHQAQLRLEEATKGLTNAIGESLAPVLTPMINNLADWVKNNKDLIGQDVAGFVAAAVPGIKNFAKQANDVAQALGGWKTILDTVGTLILGGWALRMVSGLNPLVLALAGIAVTIEKIGSFEERSSPKNLPVGSPLWNNVPEEEQGNYANSPRSQEFLKKVDPNPNPWWDRNGFFNHDSNAPRGIRNNNPLNLQAAPGQQSDGRFGVYKSMEEGVAANARQLLINQDKHGLNTVSGQISRWAPPGENDTSGYITGVSKILGVNPNDKIDVHDPEVMRKMISVMAKHENGRAIDSGAVARGVDMALSRGQGAPVNPSGNQAPPINVAGGQAPVNPSGNQAPPINVAGGQAPPLNIATAAAAPQNLNGGSGAASPQPQTTTVKGSADLKVRVETAPGLQSKTTATTDGSLFSGAPLISQSMAW